MSDDAIFVIPILAWFIALIVTKYYGLRDEVSFFICLAVFLIIAILL